jgi:hypothetical protein
MADIHFSGFGGRSLEVNEAALTGCLHLELREREKVAEADGEIPKL